MTRRVLLDTDLAMGAQDADIDDGFALAAALADPEISLELVTTVGGNSDVRTSTRLTSDMLEMLGSPDVPVVTGAGVPIDPRWRAAGASLAADSDSRPETAAAVAIVDHVMASPGELTVVAIGPLTNLAAAVILEPQVAELADFVVMGGAYFKHTNVAAMPGEYNFWCDPHAASILLSSGADPRLVGLDVTERVRLTLDDVDRLAQMSVRGKRFAPYAARCAAGWIAYQRRTKVNDLREHDSCALHDVLAVAAVAHPELLTFVPAHVAVEADSSIARGIAVADLLRWENPPAANARVAVDVRADELLAWFFDRIASLP